MGEIRLERFWVLYDRWTGGDALTREERREFLALAREWVDLYRKLRDARQLRRVLKAWRRVTEDERWQASQRLETTIGARSARRFPRVLRWN